MIEIDEKVQKISAINIDLFEHGFGRRLPDDYRKFLLLNNGGLPSPNLIHVEGLLGSPTDVQVFFGIDRRVDSSNLFWNLKLVRDRSQRRNILPIACDSGGNLFCLQATREALFEVVYFDMSHALDKAYEVALNFDAFIDKIHDWDR